MSNKLKTLSEKELEHFISEKVGEYIDEDCRCTVSELDTPYIDTEADIAETDERTLSFHVKLSYSEG